MHDNELRVGNYVGNRVYQNWPPIRVDAANIYNDYDILLPIPLTEKWLIDFGFQVDSDQGISMENTGDRIIYAKDISISLKAGIFRFFIDISEDSWYSFEWTELNYVHQLQNLYFALTEKELVIKS